MILGAMANTGLMNTAMAAPLLASSQGTFQQAAQLATDSFTLLTEGAQSLISTPSATLFQDIAIWAQTSEPAEQLISASSEGSFNGARLAAGIFIYGGLALVAVYFIFIAPRLVKTRSPEQIKDYLLRELNILNEGDTVRTPVDSPEQGREVIALLRSDRTAGWPHVVLASHLLTQLDTVEYYLFANRTKPVVLRDGWYPISQISR